MSGGFSTHREGKGPLFQQRHYVWLADVLGKGRAPIGGEPLDNLCHELWRDNPRFDAGRFRAAVSRERWPPADPTKELEES